MHQLRFVGDYQVLRLLVSCSQSFSYKVKSNNQIFRLTAVPLSIPESPTSNQLQLLERLVRKCQKYKLINHPNVEKIHDVFYFEENGLYFFAIVGERSTDKDLEDLIQEDNTNNLQELKQVMIDLCSALDYLQKCSIIHSNINPENIRKIGQNYKITFPTFKEIMWFNCRIENKSQNKLSDADYYISPELKGGIVYSSSTDVWSLGIIFYQMLSGKQFKFDSNKLPSQMGNFTEAMLSSVPNPMMRSMLKEMLNIDNKARINICRVKNIIMNTEISQFDSSIQEDILENIYSHILSLPIFVTQVMKQSEKNPIFVQGDIDYIEFQIDRFSITIVYKTNNKSLDLCFYKNDQDYSFHIQYTFQSLPNTFLAIFNNTQQIFKQLKHQRLKITTISLFGQIIFSLDDEHYQILKTIRQEQLQRQNYLVSSSNPSKKQTKTKYLHKQTIDNQSQDSLPWYLKNDKDMLNYDHQINQNIVQKQKLLNQLLISDRNFDNQQNIRAISDKIFKLYYFQQNYSRCIQLNETILPYYSRHPTHIFVGKIIGQLIACSELLNDNQQILKWRQLLQSKYAEQAIICNLYASMQLQETYQLYMQNRRYQQSTFIYIKLKQYPVFIVSELDNCKHLDDLLIDRLLPVLTIIFKLYYIYSYEIACLILTRIYNQLKNSALASNQLIVKTIIRSVKQIIIASPIRAPILYQTLTNWLRANIPEQYAKLPKNDSSDYDYPY